METGKKRLKIQRFTAATATELELEKDLAVHSDCTITPRVTTHNLTWDDLKSFADSYKGDVRFRGFLRNDLNDELKKILITDMIYDGEPEVEALLDMLEMGVYQDHHKILKYKPEEQLIIKIHYE
jgi:hypothetical protein